MKRSIRFRLNGRPTTLDTSEDRTLLWVLRTDLALTGAKYGCGVGVCGSCSVVVDGKAVRSCQASLKDVQGARSHHDRGAGPATARCTRLQQAFVDHGGLQCGFCTPGMIMNAYGLLLADPRNPRARR